MKIHRLASQLWLPQKVSEVFPIFADAANLELLTPPWLRFEIVTPRPVHMQAGTRIDYRLRVHGIPLRWRSEITVWEPPFLFTDEQLQGPYRLWKHDHIFCEKDGGTLCIDSIQYAVAGGALIDRLFVRRDLEKIFQFRRGQLSKIFSAPSGTGGLLGGELALPVRPSAPSLGDLNLASRSNIS